MKQATKQKLILSQYTNNPASEVAQPNAQP